MESGCSSGSAGSKAAVFFGEKPGAFLPLVVMESSLPEKITGRCNTMTFLTRAASEASARVGKLGHHDVEFHFRRETREMLDDELSSCLGRSCRELDGWARKVQIVLSEHG